MMPVRLLGLICLAVLLGCGDNSSGSSEKDSFRVVLHNNVRLPEKFSFQILSDGDILEIFCPEPEGVDYQCEGNVADFDPRGFLEKQSWSVVVKAPGFEFAYDTLNLDPDFRRERHLVYEVDALPGYEQNEDFFTGYRSNQFHEFLSRCVSLESELGTLYEQKIYLRAAEDGYDLFFINTPEFELHYDFAREALSYPGNRIEFTLETYKGVDRTAYAGTLLFFSDLKTETAGKTPMALSFFPSDSIGVREIERIYRLVQERLEFASLSSDSLGLFYIPGEERSLNRARDSLEFLNQRGLRLLSSEELYGEREVQILNEGEAYGILRMMSPEELDTAVVSAGDILVLTRLPNTLPIVGGTITGEWQTPLAHVNLMARSRGTPNIALRNVTQNEEIQSFLGQPVHFTVNDGSYSLSESTLEEVEEFLLTRRPEPFMPEYNDSAIGLKRNSEIGFLWRNFFGVKAANNAELYNFLEEVGEPLGISDMGPYGMAVPFSWYSSYMNENHVSGELCAQAYSDCVGEGRHYSVCREAQEICEDFSGLTFREYGEALESLTSFQVDAGFREAVLAGLRFLIEEGTLSAEKSEQLDNMVSELFGHDKIRMRSSTNAEDLEGFSGAGLYTSVSGNDYEGGVLRKASERILKVWASVWNWKAYEERSFWNIDHASVRMGVAINRAYDDEQVNGVIITENLINPAVPGLYMNAQLGEVSVTNPEGGELPEISALVYGDGWIPSQQILQYSSLSPSHSLLTNSELQLLYDFSHVIQGHFQDLYNQQDLVLDMEFKLLAPNRKLFFKQVRPYVN
jgi:hypothetical protein